MCRWKTAWARGLCGLALTGVVFGPGSISAQDESGTRHLVFPGRQGPVQTSGGEAGDAEDAYRRRIDELQEQIRALRRESSGLAKDANRALAEAERRAEKAEAERERALQDLGRARAELDQAQGTLKTAEALQAEREQELRLLRQSLSHMVGAGGAAPAAPGTETDGRSIDELLRQADAWLKQGDVVQAAALFRTVQGRAPDAIGARVGLAACHYENGQLDVARALVDEVLEIDSDFPAALGLRGMIAWRENDLREAQRMLSRAVKADGRNATLYNHLGIVHYARGRHSDAQRALETAVAIDPADHAIHHNLAVVLAGRSSPDLAAARRHYQMALDLGAAADPALEKALGR